MALQLDLTGGLTATGTVTDPAAVTLAGPVGARGQLVVTRGGTPVATHTFKVDESPRPLPGDWFVTGDTLDATRWAE